VAAVHWSTAALRDYDALLEWLDRHRGPPIAARAAAMIVRAAATAARNPRMNAWVGARYQSLEGAPQSYRRILTAPPYYVVFYRIMLDEGGVELLRTRGATQAPPNPRDLNLDS
jgi:plasmid stabilization system protein ParE